MRCLVAAALVAVAAAGCSSSSHPSPPPTTFRPRIYAALGDSYAAGEGLAPFESDSGPCHRSPSAYPRVVAAQEGSALGFLACSGATVTDVVEGQVAAVDPAADLVTVMVGGNDLGFASVIGSCVLDSAPCSRLDAQVESDLAKLGPVLEAAYRAVRAHAPRARVLVVGYPQIVADPATANIDACPVVAAPLLARRISADDARWLREKGVRLSTVIKDAAKAADATYVDVAGDFSGHEACAADPWLTGVVLPNLTASFHPTVAGQAEVARLVTRAFA